MAFSASDSPYSSYTSRSIWRSVASICRWMTVFWCAVLAEKIGLIDAINEARLNVWARQPKEFFERAIDRCRRGRFRQIVLRGDTAFSQSEKLDEWDRAGVTFYFGFKAMDNLKEMADNLPKTAWKKLVRPPRYAVKTETRRKPENVKGRVVCKNIFHEKGERRLFDEIRYFFHITNDGEKPAAEVVFEANDRCGQEKPGRWQKKHRAEKQRALRMEFRTFVNAFLKLPCQIVRTGRRCLHTTSRI